MIRNNLSVLLTQRGLKANRVSNDTGIARSTLSSLTNNDSKMVQLETVNTLCRYLNVSPNDFFEFVPFDVEFKCFINELTVMDTGESPFEETILTESFSGDGYLSKISNSETQTFDLSFSYDLGDNTSGFYLPNQTDEEKRDINFKVMPAVDNKQTDDTALLNFFNHSLSVGFQTDVKKQIMTTIRDAWEAKMNEAASKEGLSPNTKMVRGIFHFDF